MIRADDQQTRSDAEHRRYLRAPTDHQHPPPAAIRRFRMIYPSSLTSVSPSFCLSSHLSSPLRRTTSSRTRVTLHRDEL